MSSFRECKLKQKTGTPQPFPYIVIQLSYFAFCSWVKTLIKKKKKVPGRGKCLLLTFTSSKSTIEGSQSRTSKQECGGKNWSRGVVEYCLLICSHGSLSLIFCLLKDYLPRYGTIHSGLDSATSLENVPIRFVHRPI